MAGVDKDAWVDDVIRKAKEEAEITRKRLNNLAAAENVELYFVVEVYLRELNKKLKEAKR